MNELDKRIRRMTDIGEEIRSAGVDPTPLMPAIERAIDAGRDIGRLTRISSRDPIRRKRVGAIIAREVAREVEDS